MKNVANYISISRAIMSIILLIPETFSITFYIISNKITGFVLFIAPFIIVNVNSILFESIICSIATFAAVQEGHYIRTRNYNI